MSPTRAAWAAALLAAIVLLPGLGARDLWAPDEPRYGRIAEELRALESGPGGLVLLRLHGEPYTQKPPLYYWLAAAAGAPSARVGEVAARLPSALSGIALVAITLLLGNALHGRLAAGVWSAAVLGSTWRFAELAGRAQLDVLLALCETTALVFLWRLDRGRMGRRPALLAVHAALGAALLTKGPVGLLPLAVWAVFLAWEGRLAEWRRVVPAWALAVSLGPVLLWIAAATALAPPGFFDEAVIHNVWARFFEGTAHVRPWHYYAIQLPLEALPWTLVWPWAIAWALRRARSAGGAPAAPQRLLLAWVATFVVFFSLSSGKRGLYLLPAFPALALLVGAWLEARLRTGGPLPAALPRALALAALALALGSGAIGAMGGFELDAFPGFRLSRPAGFGVASLVALGLLAGTIAARRRAPTAVVAAVPATLAALQLWVFVCVLPAFDAEKSPRPLARAAVAAAGPGGPIGVFAHRALTGGIAYYSDRPVAAVGTGEAAERFLARPGAVLIVRRDRLERLERALGGELERVAQRRSGRRSTWIVRAARGAAGERPPSEASAGTPRAGE